MAFTHLEKCNMLELYLKFNKNSDKALECYIQQFPDRDVPDRRYFLKLYRRLRSNETVFIKKRIKNDFILSQETEINVLAYFQVHPNNSVRDLSRESGVSRSTIHKILKKNKYVPFKYQPVQTLLLGDYQRRLTFAQWFINAFEENHNFFRHILWSDESNFSNRGMINKRNNHYWSRENPFVVYPCNPQHRFSLNVWCGIIGSRIVGPFFYRGSLTGERYVALLTEILENFLDELNLVDRQIIYFQQDGAPAHNHRETRELLERLFGNRWIGTNGPIQWPARSPDMTPLDFFLWGAVKNQVYKHRYAIVDELQERISNIINAIDGRTILGATRNVHTRLRKCIEMEGDVFEHLI